MAERRIPEQPNKADASEVYRLEDILREFSSKPESPKTVSEQTIPFQPIHTAVSKPSEDAPVKTFGAESPTEPEQDIAATDESITLIPPMDTEAAVASLLRKSVRGMSLQCWRTVFLLLLTLSALLLRLNLHYKWLYLPKAEAYQPILRILFLSVAVLLSYDVLWRGLCDLIRLQISPFTLAFPLLILSFSASIRSLDRKEEAYSAVVGLYLYFLLRALYARRRGTFLTLRTVCSFRNPMGIFDAKQILKDTDSLRRGPADMELFLRDFLAPERAQTVLSIYCTVLLPLSAALAYLLCPHSRTGFLNAWLFLLLGATPFSAALCYPRALSRIARRLSKNGGALSGWCGAKLFGGRHTIILRDEDLFPQSSIALNGMKLFEGCKAGRVISYALAALEIAGSPLCSLFIELLHSQHGRRCSVSEHRIYDHNGVGAEIEGNVVLVGTLRFMQSMGVQMPAGARVRQAVYVSVNGELAGIFAVQYKPNASTRIGLRSILANENFSVVAATRDFLITPALIAAKYAIPTDRIKFPPYAERIRLSELGADRKAAQGGLIAKDAFGGFAYTVAAGRTLRITAFFTILICLIAGFLGLLLCTLILSWDALHVASPLHLVAFQTLWALVVSLITLLLIRL